METKTKDTLVVYHDKCADGLVAAWACWREFGERAEYFAASYAGDGEDVVLPDVKDRRVVMVDFCTGRPQLLQLLREAERVLVIDHHKSAMETCGDLPCCTFDMARSGAAMAWDHFNPSSGTRPWVVDYAQDRDLWKFELPSSREVSAVIRQCRTIGEVQLLYEHVTLNDAMRAGAAIVGSDAAHVANMAEHARKFIVRYDLVSAKAMAANGPQGAQFVVQVANAPPAFASDLGHVLAEGSPFSVVWFARGDGQVQYSLRSSERGLDVSEVAKAYGGGGHKHAAGFTSKKYPHELWAPYGPDTFAPLPAPLDVFGKAAEGMCRTHAAAVEACLQAAAELMIPVVRLERPPSDVKNLAVTRVVGFGGMEVARVAYESDGAHGMFGPSLRFRLRCYADMKLLALVAKEMAKTSAVGADGAGDPLPSKQRELT